MRCASGDSSIDGNARRLEECEAERRPYANESKQENRLRQSWSCAIHRTFSFQ